MTARQAGQRISGLSRRPPIASGSGRRRPNASRSGAEPFSAREKRRLAQLVICGVTFAALVAIKLLLPAQMEKLSNAVSSFLNQNINVTSVFSAVGKAISGEESVKSSMDDVYQEVFHPEGKIVETAVALDPDFGELTPLGTLHQFAKGNASSLNWVTSRSTAGTVTEAATAETQPPAKAEDTAQTVPAKSTGATGDAAASTDTSKTMQLSYILYSNQNVPDNVSLEQAVLGFDYCTPVCGTLSSNFGYREHPIEGEEKFHYGVDLAANTGTEIDCFADGIVNAVGESSSYGKYVIVSHADGYSTLYAHCSAVTVSSGAAVKEGQKIAEVGETGLATGPHLHFELHAGDTYLDPIYYVNPA